MARTILETLRVVTDDPDDVNSVLNVMTKLADDVGKGIYLNYIKYNILGTTLNIYFSVSLRDISLM